MQGNPVDNTLNDYDNIVREYNIEVPEGFDRVNSSVSNWMAASRPTTPAVGNGLSKHWREGRKVEETYSMNRAPWFKLWLIN